ncbi:unnamed protein product [Linum trigynum]|uniref:Uncharacterized protein n=1 Tax=Linum trigynum TaxID=586398 RepID=A0AAV2DXG8_9ROSI
MPLSPWLVQGTVSTWDPFLQSLSPGRNHSKVTTLHRGAFITQLARFFGVPLDGCALVGRARDFPDETLSDIGMIRVVRKDLRIRWIRDMRPVEFDEAAATEPPPPRHFSLTPTTRVPGPP